MRGRIRRIRTPRVIQMEAVECGVAALGIILGYYGKFVSLEELRMNCGVSRDGVNAWNIVLAARNYGLEADGYHVELSELQQVFLPAIVYWNNNHFVVLESIQQNRVYINDPATGPRTVSLEEFQRSFSSVVLIMKPGPKFQKGGKPHAFWKDLFGRLTSYKESILYLFIAQLLLVILALFLPTMSRIFIDKMLGEMNLSWTFGFLGILTSVMFFTGLMTFLQGMFLNKVNIRMNVHFSSAFLNHVLKLPLLFFTQRYGGEIIHRMRLNTSIAGFLTGTVIITVINLLFIFVYLIIMVQYDLYLTLIALLAALLNGLMIAWISKSRTDAYARIQQEQAKTIGSSLEALTQIETMKANGNDTYFFSRIAGYYTKYINALQEIGKKDVFLAFFARLVQQGSVVLLLAFGSLRIMEGYLTVGMLIALQMLINLLLQPFTDLVDFSMKVQSFGIDLNRLDDVLKNKTDPLVTRICHKISDKGGRDVTSDSSAMGREHYPRDKARPIGGEDGMTDCSDLPRVCEKSGVTHRPLGKEGNLNGHLEMQGVSFGYNPLDEPLIDQFQLTLHPGHTAAVIGEVGSGKTTVAKLAASLFSPRSGTILYDGKEASRIPRDLFSSSIAHVDQEICLFSGSIKENITLWDPRIKEEELIRAMKDACIFEDIMGFPHQLHLQLAEGGRNLSQGQRQRLEIARALAKNPSLLILDEAMSSLDSETEMIVLKNIQQRDCSCLIITHRLSSIEFCNEIIVLEKGKISQRGTHQELIRQGGLYKEMRDYGNS